MSKKTVTTVTDHESPALRRGRLAFGIDATASRAPTWAIASKIQADMFRSAAPIGQLFVKLIFYRGSPTPEHAAADERGQCLKTQWVISGEQLTRSMQKIECVSGLTQIDRIMEHVLHEIAHEPVAALVFIGDAMEEDLSKLSLLASELGARNTPMYLFQEGDDPAVRKAFQLLAQKSGGKYFEFNPAAAHAVEQLSDQLNAIARLAVGDDTAVQLLEKRKS